MLSSTPRTPPAQALGVAVLVSRVYGGVLLGPARFEHIRAQTRAVLEAAGARPDTLLTPPGVRGFFRAF